MATPDNKTMRIGFTYYLLFMCLYVCVCVFVHVKSCVCVFVCVNVFNFEILTINYLSASDFPCIVGQVIIHIFYI